MAIDPIGDFGRTPGDSQLGRLFVSLLRFDPILNIEQTDEHLTIEFLHYTKKFQIPMNLIDQYISIDEDKLFITLKKSAMHLFDALANFYLTAMPTPADQVIKLDALIDQRIRSLPIRSANEWFWPSGINSPYSCNRRLALMRMENIWTDRVPEDTMAVRRMSIGVLLHAHLQNELLGPGGQLYGHWKCPSCLETRHRFQTFPRDLCDGEVRVTYQGREPTIRLCRDAQAHLMSRGQAAWHYEELRLRDAILGISGRVDGILLRPSRRWLTVEAKSVGADVFNDQRRSKISPKNQPTLIGTELMGATLLKTLRPQLPKPEHFNQAGIYSEMLLQMAALGGLPSIEPNLYEGTLVVYINRETYETRSFIRRNSAASLDAANETISLVRSTVAQADLVVREDPGEEQKRIRANRTVAFQLAPACSTRDDGKALSCPWRTECFPFKQASRNEVLYLK